MKHYYISNNNNPQGPFLLEDLPAHGLNANSMIWHDEMTDWQPANTVAAVQALLPKLPPPLNQGPAINNTGAPLRPAFPVAEHKAQSPINHKKWWAMGGGVVVVSILLLMSFARDNNGSGASAYATPTIESGQNNQLSDSNTSTVQAAQARNDAAAAQKAAEARQVAEAQAKEAKRVWNREHFLEFVDAEVLPGYTYRPVGGVSSGYFRFTNKSGYRLQNIVVAIEYIKSDGETYTVKQMDVGDLAANSSATAQFPSCGRGVRVHASTNHLEAPGLEYVYDARGQADAMTAEADARAAERGGY